MDKRKAKHTLWDSRIFWAFVSLLASVLLWVYVTTTQGDVIEQTYEGVSVVFNGEDVLRENEGLVVANISSNTVSVRIRATRRELSKLSSSNIVAYVDVSKFTAEGMYNQSVSVQFPLGSNTGSISVTAMTPKSVSFNLVKTSVRSFEVSGKFTGTVAEGFAAQPLQFSPSSITLDGPESDLERVAYVWAEVSGENVSKTITSSTPYKLMDADGKELKLPNVTANPQTVSVTIPVTATKEIPLTVDLAEGGGATAEDVKITCDPATITVAGDADTLAGLNKISLGTVDLSSFAQTFEDSFKIVLDNGITNVTGITSAKVTIEIVGLETRKYSVTNLSLVNTPDGKTASIVTENVEVTLRGTAQQLDSVQANNIRVVADLSGLGTTTGVFEPPARVYIDGVTGVGAIGNYTFYVRLT